jgi:hypothetical protein
MVTLHFSATEKTEVNVEAVDSWTETLICHQVFSNPGDPEMRKLFISVGRDVAENLPFSRPQNRVTIPNYVPRKTRTARILD